MALSLFSDPFGLTDIDRAVSRAMTPFLRSTPTPTFGPMMTTGTVSHPMDVIEMNDRYSIVADAPGMTPEDIKVEITAGNLVVSGEKTQQTARDSVEAGVRTHRSERTFNSFSRSFALPPDAKEEGINAKLTNGVLTVDVPKEPKPAAAQPKRIQVASQERGVPVQPTK